jgi:hypothetical protein
LLFGTQIAGSLGEKLKLEDGAETAVGWLLLAGGLYLVRRRKLLLGHGPFNQCWCSLALV